MNIDQLAIAAIRSTCIDGTNLAKSGHPGMPLGSAPILYTLYAKHLVSDPLHPDWINRDRFVLSAGHASMLLYTMLHVSGFDVTMEDIKHFRQLDSRTPGHPEYGHTAGVDATTGPLGQGLAQAVGMAMAEASLAAIYPEGEKLFNHYTYVLTGDGCLQEGISQEAISLAGHQKLNKLIVMYDSNAVTLDGPLANSFSENVGKRFEASGWNVQEVPDGNDVKEIDKAIGKAKKSDDKPNLIIVHTVIGFGSAYQGTSKVHGAPLGEVDGSAAKLSYGYTYPPFTIPAEVYDLFKTTIGARGAKAFLEWTTEVEKYRVAHPQEGERLTKTIKHDVSAYVFTELPEFAPGFKDSTRNTSQAVLNLLNGTVANLIGGSADVAKSVMTTIARETDFAPGNRKGRNINFGIREFAMASAQNGMLLHGGLRTYVGSFLVFSDYMKSAIRTAALSHLPGIFLFSHDTIALGEDGPTHQPIEHIAMLRSIPNMTVIRPCDATETASAWKLAMLSQTTPTALILSRQSLPLMPASHFDGVAHGGYVISAEKDGPLDFALIATGSEVSLAVAAQQQLAAAGVNVRVISLPSWELFEKNDDFYKESVFGVPYERRLAIEMLSPLGWHKYARHVIGMESFGASAPAGDAMKKFGFTVEDVVANVKTMR
jgi:transketolase